MLLSRAHRDAGLYNRLPASCLVHVSGSDCQLPVRRRTGFRVGRAVRPETGWKPILHWFPDRREVSEPRPASPPRRRLAR
jgi:hypothetical protein